MNIILAYEDGDMDRVRELVKYIDNPRGYEESSALRLAVLREYSDLVGMMVDTGVYLDFGGDDGKTPLILACALGYTSLASLLIYSGCNINLRDSNGMTALIHTCMQEERENERLVEEIIHAGGEVNVQDRYGYTALMYAARNSYKRVVQTLLDVPGIRLDLKSMDGDTALDMAYNDEIEKMIYLTQSNRNG